MQEAMLGARAVTMRGLRVKYSELQCTPAPLWMMVWMQNSGGVVVPRRMCSSSEPRPRFERVRFPTHTVVLKV